MTDQTREPALVRALRAQRGEAMNMLAHAEARIDHLCEALEVATHKNATLQSQLDDARAQLARGAA